MPLRRLLCLLCLALMLPFVAAGAGGAMHHGGAMAAADAADGPARGDALAAGDCCEDMRHGHHGHHGPAVCGPGGCAEGAPVALQPDPRAGARRLAFRIEDRAMARLLRPDGPDRPPRG